MTKEEIQNPIADLNREIASLIKKFGRGRTLLAIFRSYLTFKSRPPDLNHLEGYLRKDIGLSEKLPERKRAGWDSRF